MAKNKITVKTKGKTKKEAVPKKDKRDLKPVPEAPGSEAGPCLRAFDALVDKLGLKDREKMSADLELLHNAVARCPVHCGCSDQEKTSVIFSAEHAFLGELVTRSGGLAGLIMSRDGDALLGPHVEAWQVMGLRQNETMTPVKLRDERFLEAFGIWCGNNGCKMVTLLPSQIELWNGVQSSHLSDQERYDAIDRLAHQPLEEALDALQEIAGV